ncbi:MAG: hypothetical protein J2P30_06970 [Actinobacteria bacterium]|nr:hypothetical protein [Actinomycetota bacterium]
MGQATRARHEQRRAGACEPDEFPDACPVTQAEPGHPADGTPFAGPGGDADPGADGLPAADGDAAADEPGHHRAGNPGTHPAGDHVRDSLARLGPRRGTARQVNTAGDLAGFCTDPAGHTRGMLATR